MATIATVAVNLTAGTAQFAAGMQTANKSLEQFGYVGREAKRVYESVRTPTEEYAQRVGRLKELLNAGKLSQDVYNRGLVDAKRKLEEAGGAAEKVHSIFGEVFKADALVEGLKMGAEAIKSLVEHVVEAGKEMAEFVKGQGEAVLEMSHFAERTGLSIEYLSRLEYGAQLTHVSIEALTGGIQRMLKNLGDVGNDEGAKAAEALERLHLDGKKLAEESPALALDQIAAAISGIANAQSRASLTQSIFGKQGQELENLLAKLHDFDDAAEQTGNVVNSIDARNVMEAAEAVAKIESLLQGIARRLAIEISPYVKALSDYFFDAGTAGANMGDKVVSALEAVAVAAATTADNIESAYYALLKIQNVGAYIGIAASNMIPGAGAMTSTFTNDIKNADAAMEAMAGHSKSWGDQLKQTFDEIRAKAHAASSIAGGSSSGGDFGGDAAAPLASLDEMLSNSRKSADAAASYVQRLHDQLAALHQGGDSIELEKLSRQFEDLGKSIAESDGNLPLAQYRSLMQDFRDLAKSITEAKGALESLKIPKIDSELDKFFEGVDTKYAENLKKIQDEGKRVFEGTRTPAEKFAETQSELQKLLDAGAISFDTYSRAILKAKEAAEGLHHAQESLKNQNAQEIGFGVNLSYLSGLGESLKGIRSSTHGEHLHRHGDPARLGGMASGAQSPFQFGDPFSGATPGSGSSPAGSPFGDPFVGVNDTSGPALAVASATSDPSKTEMIRLLTLMQKDFERMRQDWENTNA